MYFFYYYVNISLSLLSCLFKSFQPLKIGLFYHSITGISGHPSLINEKDHHYFLNRFVCVGEFFDG